MSADQIVFLLVATLTVACSVMVVTSRRMIHAALWFILVLFGVAVSYAFLQASFFVVIQVIVYIGAIAILVIFAVMLTRGVMEVTTIQINPWWWLAFVIVASLFGVMLWVIGSWNMTSVLPQYLMGQEISIADLGKALVDPEGYVIPFEVASLLLLAALIGSIFIASERKGSA